jgi:chromosome segregation ATPase
LPPASAGSAQPAGASTAADEANPQPANDQAKPGGEAAPSKAAPAEQADAGGGNRAQTEAALKRAKAELAQAQSELDVLQRKAALDSDTYYSKADYARDTEGKAQLDADTQQVNDKKSQVEELKAKVAALQSELGEAAEPEKPSRLG